MTVPVSLPTCTEEICFGTYVVRDITIHDTRILPDHGTFTPAQIRGSKICISEDAREQKEIEVGTISCLEDEKILLHLEEAQDISLEVYCRVIHTWTENKAKKRHSRNKHELIVVVFGSHSRFDDIRYFFDTVKINLQDPIYCLRNVPYKNPQMLCRDDIVEMTHDVIVKSGKEHFKAPENVFDCLLESEHEAEAADPKLLKTGLHSHQRRALHFMLWSEKASRIGTTFRCMWLESVAPSIQYVSTITGEICTRKPNNFSGGIIADQMGLGKTLQMIALIASDYEASHIGDIEISNEILQDGVANTCTLIVVPLSLLKTWNDQFCEHVLPHTLRWYTFHGQRRRLDLGIIKSHNVVLTTYEVVMKEYQKTRSQSCKALLFSYNWRRVILDEAHCIKNPKAVRTEAICSLSALSRWAVSGTPIQNRLVDLAALVHFLRIPPFDDPDVFENHIVRPWKQNSDITALEKLKKLVQAITLRRDKGVLGLPDRHNLIRRIEFSSLERQQYENLRLRIKDTVQTLDQRGGSTSETPHILRWIDDLRGLCSHGARTRHDTEQQDPCIGSRKRDRRSEDHYNPKRNASAHTTSSELDGLEDQVFAASPWSPQAANLDMHDATAKDDTMLLSPNWVPRQSQDVSYSPSSYSSVGAGSRSSSIPLSNPESEDETATITSKVESLLSDLHCHEGKSVVFSYWRAGLDVVASALRDADIKFERVDGSLPNAAREKALTRFRTQSDIKVMLATIAVAGVGLDLTVANLVCLLEPQWNPSIEEQALSRVHRMRQIKPVTTIRYVIRDSIEESILKLQEKKMRLAQLALSDNMTNFDQNTLEDLKSLLS